MRCCHIEIRHGSNNYYKKAKQKTLNNIKFLISKRPIRNIFSSHLIAAFLLDGCGSTRTDDNSSAGSDETDHESVSFVLGSMPNLTTQQSTSSSSTGGASSITAQSNQVDRCVENVPFAATNSKFLLSSSELLVQPTPPVPILPRNRKLGGTVQQTSQPILSIIPAKAPLPPPRRIQSQQRYHQQYIIQYKFLKNPVIVCRLLKFLTFW